MVLDCNEDCKKEPLPSSDTPDNAAAAAAESAAAAEAESAPDAAELRQRRKDKQQKKEEEIEQRRLKQELTEQTRLRRKRCRNGALGLWALFMVVLLAFFVKALRDQNEENRKEDLLQASREKRFKEQQGRR